MAKYVLGQQAARQVGETVRRVRQLPVNFRGAPQRGLQGFSYKSTSLRLFELVETLTEGRDQTATAKRARWKDDAFDVSEDEADEFTVRSFIAHEETEAGARGIAMYLFGEWIIMQLECPDGEA